MCEVQSVPDLPVSSSMSVPECLPVIGIWRMCSENVCAALGGLATKALAS